MSVEIVLYLLIKDDGFVAGYAACRAHVKRATPRPYFRKTHIDQMDHFAAAY